MAGDTESRAWTDLDGNRTIFDANGNIQFNEVARGYNWEYSVSVQHELMPKVSPHDPVRHAVGVLARL